MSVAREKPWTEALSEQLQRDLNRLREAASNVFSDFRPKQRPPTRRERVQAFLSMTRDERLQLFSEMGPEEYGKFILKGLEDLEAMIGPAAKNLLPYFYADGIPLEAVGQSAEEVQQILTAAAMGDSLPQFLTDLLEEEQA